MTTTPQTLTAEDLWRMPDTERRELVKGELRTMAPAGFDHGAVIDNLQFLLSRHVRENHLGHVLGAETGFLLARNPDTVRGADIAFVSTARLPAGGRPLGYFPGPPDLAVEVVSPGDLAYEVEEKVAEYLQAGVPLVWIVNPPTRSVRIRRPKTSPNGPAAELSGDDPITGEDILPGFSCKVSEFFA